MIPNLELWITFVLISCSLVLLWFVSSALFFSLLPPVGCYLIRPLVVFCLLYIYIPKITAISGYGCGEMLDLLSF